MHVKVAEERSGNVVVLSPVGRVDSANARMFESVVMDRISTGERHLIVDSVSLTSSAVQACGCFCLQPRL